MTPIEEQRLNHYGISYNSFMKLVCTDCKCPCYVGEEKCERMDRMRRKYGF